ncbi:MAG: DNA polymerase I [Bradymonadaceae bacterium]|nr:DNA polymerase I [Lujinxingiaceae bacterium]
MAKKSDKQLSIDNWQDARESERTQYAGKTFYIVDGSYYIYRAFFAIRHLSNSKGMPTNAIYGFLQMLKKLIETENPDYLAMTFDAFDADTNNFRTDMYADYKATRSEMPDDLRVQLPYFRKLVHALNIPILEQPRVEADDLIATLSERAREQGFDVCIISADKDLMQLIGDRVIMYDTMREKKFRTADVLERFGVEPARVRYVLALAGDTSDNIPGVPGIGEKTGGQLIAQFGDLENLLANVDKVSGKKRQENLTTYADQARLSLALVTLREDCEIDFDLEHLRMSSPHLNELTALLSHELEFDNALKELRAWMQKRGWLDKAGHIADPNEGPRKIVAAEGKEYHAVHTLEELDAVIAACGAAERFAFDLETTSIDPLTAEIVGMSFAWEPDRAVYIPVAHSYEGAPAQLNRDVVLARVKALLESDKRQKVAQHYKYEWLVLQKYGIEFQGVAYDTMLMSYLLDPGKNSHSLDTIAQDLLGHRTIKFAEVAGSGKTQKTFDEVELEHATVYAAEDADITLAICTAMAPKLVDEGLQKLHDELEVPLSRVLGVMEKHGILINCDILGDLSTIFEGELYRLQLEINELAGGELNANSPVQLREVLFEKLELPVKKRTQTGASTDQSVLEQLAELHDLPQRILDYRSFSKLKGTYVDALPELINPTTGRVHTDFNQAVAATGRLSSSNPNLQNIPIRTDAGREIRRAFVPAPGHKLIAADYSQIELRIMAHMSQDPVLLEAYQRGLDIHAMTASQVFDVALATVTRSQRSAGKTINFGVMYGMGARRLARDLKITFHEAKRYIDNYFERYKGVTTFFDTLLEDTRKTGYTQTLYGRKRHLPGINARGGQKAFSERAAINTPIQGTAADIIKYAMIHMQDRIEADQLPMRMLLQVHDELVFEVRDDAVDHCKTIIRELMEGVIVLDAPLKVDVGVGDNWLDTK